MDRKKKTSRPNDGRALRRLAPRVGLPSPILDVATCLTSRIVGRRLESRSTGVGTKVPDMSWRSVRALNHIMVGTYLVISYSLWGS